MLKEHVAGSTVPPSVDPPAATRREDTPGPPLIGVRNVPGRVIMRLRTNGQLGARTIRCFRSHIEGSVATHPPDDFGLGPGFDRQGANTSAQRRAPFTSARGVCEPADLSGVHATVSRPIPSMATGGSRRDCLRSFECGPIWRAHSIHGVGKVLGEVLHLELRFRTLGGDAIAEHRQTEGTRRRHPRRFSP